MRKLSVRETQRSASYLLPDPGGQVVRSFLDEIDSLERQRDALLEALSAISSGNARLIQTADMCLHHKYGFEHCEDCYQEFASAAIKSVEESHDP